MVYRVLSSQFGSTILSSAETTTVADSSCLISSFGEKADLFEQTHVVVKEKISNKKRQTSKHANQEYWKYKTLQFDYTMMHLIQWYLHVPILSVIFKADTFGVSGRTWYQLVNYGTVRETTERCRRLQARLKILFNYEAKFVPLCCHLLGWYINTYIPH